MLLWVADDFVELSEIVGAESAQEVLHHVEMRHPFRCIARSACDERDNGPIHVEDRVVLEPNRIYCQTRQLLVLSDQQPTGKQTGTEKFTGLLVVLTPPFHHCVSEIMNAITEIRELPVDYGCYLPTFLVEQ